MLLIIVHRLLQSFIFPPLNSIIILMIGVGIVRFFHKTGAAILTVGLLFLYVQSIPLTAYLLTKSRELPPITENQIKSSTTIVVLGGGLNYIGNEYESAEVSVNKYTLIRLKYTAYLAKQLPNYLIVTSGGYSGRYREADIMRQTLINSFGVTNNIIEESKSRNTNENAKFVANLLLSQNIHNIILVTQAYHMPRALVLFKKYGLNPIPASTDYYTSINATTTILSIIPTATAMAQTTLILHELLGTLFYKYLNLLPVK